MLSSWISRQLFEFHDSQRIFEEMDKNQLEVLFLEHLDDFGNLKNSKNSNFTMFLTISGIFGASGYFLRHQISNNFLNLKILAAIFGVGITVGMGTVAVGKYWWLRKMGELKRAIEQMERTKRALRRRRQVYFSISNRLPPSRNPLISRACRITVESIDILIFETKNFPTVTSLWIDLYTPEMMRITAKNVENPEKLEIEMEHLKNEEEEEELDFEVVFETLIAMFKLHASEYSRFLITDFLENSRNFWKNLENFRKTCGRLKEQRAKLEEVEKLAVKGGENRKKLEKSTEKMGFLKNEEIGWKQQISMAMDAILEGLETDKLSRNEVELALRRALLIVGSSDSMGNGNPTENVKNSISADLENGKNEEKGEVKVFEKGERTDVDMVFEGTSLSDAEKRSSGIARDVLLDGSEAKKHEKSLFGELKMVLEPRREHFKKREKKALAKFYGVEEEELEERDIEENFEGLGQGDGLEEPEPYDWRKEAESSEGIHQQSDNDEFLNALAARRVRDDVIE